MIDALMTWLGIIAIAFGIGAGFMSGMLLAFKHFGSFPLIRVHRVHHYQDNP